MASSKAVRIEIKQKRLDMYYDAEEAILSGAQSYSLGTRSLTRANLADIRSAIEKLENEIAELSADKPRKAFSVVPRDF